MKSYQEMLASLTAESLKYAPPAIIRELKSTPEGKARLEEIEAEQKLVESVSAPKVKYGVPISEITWDILKKMPPDRFRELRSTQEGQAKIREIVEKQDKWQRAQDGEVTGTATEAPAEVAETPSTEETAALTPEEEAAIAAQAAEAQRQAAEAEATRVKAEAEAVKAAEEANKNKRWVIDFQARDEEGNPIGTKTHLEASSQEELIEKMKNSYEHAVRAIERLKKRPNPTYKQEQAPVVISQEELDQAAADIASDDLAKRRAAVELIASKQAEPAKLAAQIAERTAVETAHSLNFLRDHISDYYNCEANALVLKAYLDKENLEWTKDNLEIAFNEVESKLAERPKPSAPEQETVTEVAANTAPAPVATTAPTAAPVVPAATVAPAPPAAPAPAATVPPANTPMKRPGVNGGLVPGSSTSGVRPQQKTAAQTREDLVKELKGMSAEEMKRRHKLDPSFYDKINAILAKK